MGEASKERGRWASLKEASAVGLGMASGGRAPEVEAACCLIESRALMRGSGSSGAQRIGKGRACGAIRVCVAYGVRRRLAALSREAEVKVMAKATEKMSWSLMRGEESGEHELA